ncbi:hypothetical protein B6A27_16790 [Anoxybacillus sp. UARK-01]|nr:hypothetical protein B6A27_16790 [Anoxybacillus sp. UARK-01]
MDHELTRNEYKRNGKVEWTITVKIQALENSRDLLHISTEKGGQWAVIHVSVSGIVHVGRRSKPVRFPHRLSCQKNAFNKAFFFM